MSVKVRAVEDQEVGRGATDYFRPEKAHQRIALVPCFISKANLTITDEIRKAGGQGSREAIEKMEEISSLVSVLDKGADKKPASALRIVQPSEGYLFAPVHSHMCHFIKGFGYVLCKQADYSTLGRSSVCCDNAKDDKGQKQEALLMHAMVLFVYDTDAEGEVTQVPADRQIPYGAGKLNFKYRIVTWSCADTKMKDWKQFHKNFPLISCDYECFTEKVGNSDRVKFAPVGPALWSAIDPTFTKKIIDEGAKKWEHVGRSLGRDLSVAEIDQMYKVSGGASISSAVNERSFEGLLAGTSAPAAPPVTASK